MQWLGIVLVALGAVLFFWSLIGRIRRRRGRGLIDAIYSPSAGSAAMQYTGFVLIVVGGVLLKSWLT